MLSRPSVGPGRAPWTTCRGTATSEPSRSVKTESETCVRSPRATLWPPIESALSTGEKGRDVGAFPDREQAVVERVLPGKRHDLAEFLAEALCACGARGMPVGL